ncbi:MAG: hypothetical protein ABL888_19890, partial [Pirellulaceae bacterium]
MSFDFVTILPFTVAVAAAVAFWGIADFFLNRRSRAESRLDVLRKRMSKKGNVEKEGKSGLTKLLEAASPSLSETLKP